ncbi:MAG: hypothetical protein HC945_01225 [Nitrosarchaeum sp.]|nr:hypothetical protein [Nitrosarchaeum sp.]
MENLRKYLVILVIAVLYSAFVFTLIESVYPNPEYDDYCAALRYPFPMQTKDCSLPENYDAARTACIEQDAEPVDIHDEQGCISGVECSTCSKEYEAARQDYALVYFSIAASLGLLSILAGLLLPARHPINEWIGSGLLLGGLIVIFGGTIVSVGDLQSYLRPIILFLELVLVIFLAYRVWGRESVAPSRADPRSTARPDQRRATGKK